MAQYIDKSALVAEIERRQNFHHKRGNQHDSCVEDVLYGILSYINTLEVKDVDLDAEWVKYFENRGDMATVNIKHLAKHFFELGLKAQKGE